MSAGAFLQGVLLSTLLVDVANVHSSARAEALSRLVPRDLLAPVLDPKKLPAKTPDGRPVSGSPAYHIQNVLRKRIERGEIPKPENVSIHRLMRVAGKLAELNKDSRGAWAGLARLSRETDTSPSHLRVIFAYLETHGHALNLSRISTDDRRIANSQRPLTDTRTTVRLVFPLTCDQAEQLSDDQVLDLIALGEQRPCVKPPSANPPEAAPSAPSVPPPPLSPPPPPIVAPELRCLVEPLAAMQQITGIALPIEWVADEAERAKLAELDHAAEAVCELNAKILAERRGAAAMGEARPKIKGGPRVCGLA